MAMAIGGTAMSVAAAIGRRALHEQHLAPPRLDAALDRLDGSGWLAGRPLGRPWLSKSVWPPEIQKAAATISRPRLQKTGPPRAARPTWPPTPRSMPCRPARARGDGRRRSGCEALRHDRLVFRLHDVGLRPAPASRFGADHDLAGNRASIVLCRPFWCISFRNAIRGKRALAPRRMRARMHQPLTAG
jgi:hypothetical protein